MRQNSLLGARGGERSGYHHVIKLDDFVLLLLSLLLVLLLLLVVVVVLSLWTSLGRNQSPVRRPVWLW